ncbi:MAG TPA: hypothetical protein VFZ25_00645 [Chloroflexota bacterium]|nr:hypothetical protein [Chloroflexota bacterium]
MSAESPIVNRAADFIWRNARLLDRRRFAHSFLGAPSAPVVAALVAYQNADGGFGNALEPDKRCPDSQPVDVEMALRILDELGDERDWSDPLVGRVIEFLATITTPEGGIPFVLPSVRAYPRAPWWETGGHPPASPNPTAAIVGLLRKHGVRHRWVEAATDYCWREISEGATEEVHELAAILTFLEHAPDRSRAEPEFQRIAERIFTAKLVELDPLAGGYVKKPLDWAPTPQSWCHRLFDEQVLSSHLDALIESQQPDGGWPISWPTVSPLVELEWRGAVTVGALKTLRAYGRL